MDEPPTRAAMRLRRTLYDQLDPIAYSNRGRDGLSRTNVAIICIVIISSVAVILETESTIVDKAPHLFAYTEYIFTGIFLAEYMARLWAEGEDPRYRGMLGRLRYALTPAAIVDLVAFLPSLIAPRISSPMLLRGFRLIRILRLASLGRFSQAIGHLSEAVMREPKNYY
jgi:voltage-gated potassium channel